MSSLLTEHAEGELVSDKAGDGGYLGLADEVSAVVGPVERPPQYQLTREPADSENWGH